MLISALPKMAMPNSHQMNEHDISFLSNASKIAGMRRRSAPIQQLHSMNRSLFVHEQASTRFDGLFRGGFFFSQAEKEPHHQRQGSDNKESEAHFPAFLFPPRLSWQDHLPPSKNLQRAGRRAARGPADQPTPCAIQPGIPVFPLPPNALSTPPSVGASNPPPPLPAFALRCFDLGAEPGPCYLISFLVFKVLAFFAHLGKDRTQSLDRVTQAA